MRFGSLFSGIGGLDWGLERAGLECAFQIENDPYCRKILAKHWSEVPKYGDIRRVDAAPLPGVDLVAGGFPCQDLSISGKGAGLSGARSGLWGEFVRILRVVRPRYVLVENVPGLLSRGMGTVLGDLSSLGYDAEWESVPAAAFGAPHLRRRVFIVAYPSGDVLEEPGIFQPEQRPSENGWWATEPRICRMAHGIPNRVDRTRGLGNAVVPQIAEWLGGLILDYDQEMKTRARERIRYRDALYGFG